MTTQEVADRLYELCTQSEFDKAKQELFAGNATSTESNMQGELETVTGMDGLMEKGRRFIEMTEEIHGGYTNEPKVFGNYIFMEMGLDATMKVMGCMKMDEMCQYEVKDGKIISERFYY
jgi:hypothetical protein